MASNGLETVDLHPKSYASTADGSAASVMTAQSHTRATVLIATNTCEEALLWQASISSLLTPAVGVNHISSMSGYWQCLPTSLCPCPSPSCPFCRRPWSKDEVILVPSCWWLVPHMEGPFKILPSSIQWTCPSQWNWKCWRRAYRLDNWTWVTTMALVYFFLTTY